MSVIVQDVHLLATLATCSRHDRCRYSLYPWVLPRMAKMSNQLLFIGTLPMALSTIVSGTAVIAVPRFGQWARDLTWALWWIDVALTLASVFGVPVRLLAECV